MTQVHLFISGIVQGVGYRQFVMEKAREVGLTGWVKNVSDGRVEAVLQGGKETIERLIDQCWEGPFLSEVKEIHSTWEDTTKEYTNFTIVKE